MSHGNVEAICIASERGTPMREVQEVKALKGAGLEGDRYCTGKGSFNRKTGVGNRQVTLINARFFEGTDFSFIDSRRNIVTRNIELMWLIGREFKIGEAQFRGIKYCDPCNRPSKLSGVSSFKETFQDAGGLICEILESGIIKVGDKILTPPKGY